ncbi:uncharacterized protein L201_006207 [Kwoniella dendrophila CBS 6074]|uniref:Uncharacterized protein n=1 Tax=Kwoniella dendrophila CBS 6074 TaxID=1295534 RepID=A0AAX4K253_9TREE
MYNLLHLFSSPLMLLEFRDHMDDGTDVVITRTDLAKAWLAAVDYIRFHAGLQNWLVKRKKLDYDFQGEDVESIIDDLSMVLDVFRYLFFELDRALALLRQCEAKHYVPLAWYKPSVAYDVRGLYDYPFALKPDTPISRLTPVFIHAAKYALMIAYDRMYREDFETIAYKTGFTWINPCKVHGLTPVKTEGDGIRAYGQDGPPADRPVFSRQCQPHL